MSVYIINYSLKNSNSCNYEKLYTEIKNYGIWAHYLETTWFVFVPDIAINVNISSEILNNLQKYIHKNDKIFVAKLSGEAAWLNLDRSDIDDATQWLNNNLDK